MGKTILIAALAADGLMGDEETNCLPWGKRSTELKHFKDTTYHHGVLMGRKTFESIGRPLEGRQNIVLSHRPKIFSGDTNLPGWLARAEPTHSLWWYDSIPKAVYDFRNIYGLSGKKLYICGGRAVYEAALGANLVDEALISMIPGHYQVAAPIFFPLSLLHDRFREDWREAREGFDLVHYRRI